MSTEKPQDSSVRLIGEINGMPVYLDPTMERTKILVGRKSDNSQKFVITGMEDFPFDEESIKQFAASEIGRKLGIL